MTTPAIAISPDAKACFVRRPCGRIFTRTIRPGVGGTWHTPSNERLLQRMTHGVCHCCRSTPLPIAIRHGA